MNSLPLSYDELTPLEQCIANKSMFARMLEAKAAEQKSVKGSRKREH